MNESAELGNSVTVQDGTDNRSDRTEIKFNHTYIKKEGSYDASTDKIRWTITINDFGGDLDGYTLSDLLKRAGSPVEIKNVYLTEYTNGSSAKDPVLIELPFVFSSSTVEDTHHKFVVNYETDVSEDGFHTNYSNSANLNKGDTGFGTGEIGVTVDHNEGILEKKYLNTIPVAGSAFLKNYEWNAIITPPKKDGIKAGAVYKDQISSEQYVQDAGTRHYITEDQLNNIQVKVVIDELGNTSDLGAEYYKIVAGSKDNDGKVTSFEIRFLKDLPEEYENKKISIDYQTTVDLTRKPKNNPWSFKNEGTFEQDGGKATDYDIVKESSGSNILKVDKGGSGNNTYIYDECKGILYYCLVINSESTLGANGPITITDTLPEGTSLYKEPYDIGKGTITGSRVNNTGKGVKLYYGIDYSETDLYQTVNRYDMPNGNGYDGFYDMNKDSGLVITCENNILNITIPEFLYYGKINIDDGTRISKPISIYYAVKIDDALGKEDEKTYKNHVTMDVGSDTYSDSIETKVIRSYLSKGLNSEKQNADKESSYRVLINPTGAMLNAGQDIKLVDSIKYTNNYLKSVSLKPNSLHLYNLNKDGSKGSEIDRSLYIVSYGENADHTAFEVNLSLKDSTPYILEYTYVFAIDVDGYFGGLSDNTINEAIIDIVNDINLSGSHVGNEQSSVTDQEYIQSSQASARIDKLTLVKVDEENQIVYLKGAEFKLQKYTGAKDNLNWKEESYWEDVKSVMTGDDGTVALTGLSYNAGYRLIETQAPTNYILDATPHYFYLEDTFADNKSYPDGLVEAAMDISTGIVTITNKAGDTDYTSVGVKKNWENSKGSAIVEDVITDIDGNVVKSIRVGLYQTTNPENLMNGVPYPAEGSNTVTLSEDNNWYHVFNNLPKTNSNGEALYYYVQESDKAIVIDKNTNTEKEIAVASSFIQIGEQSSAVDSGTVKMINRQLPKKTTVSVEKRWKNADGTEDSSDHPVIPVSLYRAEKPAQEKVPQTIAYTIKFTQENLSNNAFTLSGEVDVPAGSSVRFVITQDYNWRGLKLEGEYQIGGGERQPVTGSKNDNEYTYIVPNVTEDIVLDLKTTGYPSDYTAKVSIISGAPDSNMLELPENAECIETIYLGSYVNIQTETGSYDPSGWKYIWENLDDSYYYYVQEGTDGTIAGYNPYYEYSYKDAPENKKVDTVTITNTVRADTMLSVKKDWVGIEPDETYSVEAVLKKPDGTEESFILTKQNDWSKLWPNMPAGAYRVQEIAVKQTVTDAVTGNVKIEDVTGEFNVTYSENNGTADNNATITITNTAKPKSTEIKVVKEWKTADGLLKTGNLPASITLELYVQSANQDWVEYTNAGAISSQPGQAASPVTVVPNSSGEWSFTWDNLPEGNYYVKETKVGNTDVAMSGYTPSYSLLNSSADQVTVEEDKSAEKPLITEASQITAMGGAIVITNTEEPVTISVEKKWSDNNNASGIRPDKIEVVLYRTTEAPQTEGGDEPVGKNGSLTVSKKLTGNDTDGQKEFAFTISLNDAAINGTYSGVEFANGTATVKLRGGASKTIEGLPDGIGYTVTEADYTADGYSVKSKMGETGTIRETTVSVAEFTNEKNTYGSLYISNTVTGENADTGKYFDFLVQLDQELNGNYGDLTFVNGKATFSLKHGESKTAANIPNGVTYKVEEVDYSSEHYVTTMTGATGTICGGNQMEAKFTNTYSKASEGGEGGSAQIKIEWENGTGEGLEYVDILVYSKETYKPFKNIKVKAIDGWSTVCDGMKGGVVYYVEWAYKNTVIGYPNSVHLEYYFKNGSQDFKNGDCLTIVVTSVTATTATNADMQATLTLTPNIMSKTCAVDDITRQSEPVVLSSSKKPVGALEVLNSKKTLQPDSEGNWCYTWFDLPKTDEQGRVYYYYVEEIVPDGYDVSYDYIYKEDDPLRIEKVTITNISKQTVDITVEKKWEGYNTDVYKGYKIDVQLLKDGKIVEGEDITLPISDDNNNLIWSYTWSGLSAGYTYSVKESKVVDKNSGKEVGNYSSSIQTNGNNITITNTSTTHGYTLPETGGPGTKPYTLGGILLTVMASLLICIKNKRRKEEQGSS